MATDRLTRQELSWLLAQEARSAADMLRKGVTSLAAEPGPSPQIGEVASSLDALDDAMQALSSLHGGTAPKRRGRIDVAALLLELSPGAQLSFEPGSGTEVFGDEAELRRMLQVLLSLGVASAPAGDAVTAPLSLRRQDGRVRISVSLGPDSSVGAKTEHAWLHRMAVRHGGRLHLEGGAVHLDLPADAAEEKREVEELRRELAAAQQQGEAYARELASMFAKTESSQAPAPAEPAGDGSFAPLASLARAVSSLFRPELAELARALGAARELADGGAGDAVGRVQALSRWTWELARFGAVDPAEPPATLAAAELVQAALHEARRRADLGAVELDVSVSPGVCSLRRSAVEAAIALLATHAVDATPRGGRVRVEATPLERGLLVRVDDGGPPVPTAAREDLLSLVTDPRAVGRPDGVALFLAGVLARELGGAVHLTDAPSGGARLELALRAAG